MEEKSTIDASTPEEAVVIDLHDDDNDDGKDRGTTNKDNGIVDDDTTNIKTYATPEQRCHDVAVVSVYHLFTIIGGIGTLVPIFLGFHYGIEKYPLFLSILAVFCLYMWMTLLLLPLEAVTPVTKAEVAMKDFCFETVGLTTLGAIACTFLWGSQLLLTFAAVLAGLTIRAQFITIAGIRQTGNSTKSVPLETDAQGNYHRWLMIFSYISLLASMTLIVKGYVSIVLGHPLRSLFSSMTGLTCFAFAVSMASLANHRRTIYAPITDPSCQTFLVDTKFGVSFYFAAFLPVVIFYFSEAIFWGRQELAAFNVPLFLSYTILIAYHVPLEACQFHICSSPTATILVETRNKIYCYSNIAHVCCEDYNTLRPSPYGLHTYYGTGGRKLRKQAVVIELVEGTKLCIMTDSPTELVNAIQAAVSAATTD